jgi:hypothetical protein
VVVGLNQSVSGSSASSLANFAVSFLARSFSMAARTSTSHRHPGLDGV